MTAVRSGLATALLGLAAAAPLGAQEPGAGPAAPPAAAPAVTLAEAIRRAEQVQPRVVQAEGALDNAGARVRSAWGAYLPTVRASSSGGPSFSEGPSRPDPVTGQILSGNRSSTGVNMNLSASVDLFTGFRRGAESKAARAGRDAAGATLVDARFQQRLVTTNQFFDALAARQLVAVRQASVRRAEEQLKVSVAKLQAGSATRSDSLRSTVTLGNARLQLIQTEADLAAAEASLAALIGAPGRVQASDDSSYYRAAPVDTTQVRAEALARSPQVRAAEAGAVAARAQLGAARAGYWPTLSLSGSTGYSGSSSSDYELYNNRQLTLSLSWNLFNGFAREQQIVQQQSGLDLAEADAANARREVEAAVVAALADLEAARTRIEITGTSVAAATEDLRVQQERYRLGASTIVDVLTSQESLNQAEVDAVTARFDYLRARAQLEALIGRDL